MDSPLWKLMDAANFGWCLAFFFNSALRGQWFLAGLFAVLTIAAAYITRRRYYLEEEKNELLRQWSYRDGFVAGKHHVR